MDSIKYYKDGAFDVHLNTNPLEFDLIRRNAKGKNWIISEKFGVIRKNYCRGCEQPKGEPYSEIYQDIYFNGITWIKDVKLYGFKNGYCKACALKHNRVRSNGEYLREISRENVQLIGENYATEIITYSDGSIIESCDGIKYKKEFI